MALEGVCVCVDWVAILRCIRAYLRVVYQERGVLESKIYTYICIYLIGHIPVYILCTCIYYVFIISVLKYRRLTPPEEVPPPGYKTVRELGISSIQRALQSTLFSADKMKIVVNMDL